MFCKRKLIKSFHTVLSTAALLISLFGNVSLSGAEEKVEKIKASDALLEKNIELTTKYPFFFRDKLFFGYPDVYSPVIFPGAKKMKMLPISKGDHFLEIGCGTGVFSVLAALDGAEKVVAIDINPNAVANTIDNGEFHGVANKMEVLLGDMFSPLQEDQQFDVIFFNIPFAHRDRSVEELSMLERSLFDPEHELLRRYISEGKKHLKASGKMLLGYSTTHGDIDLMYQWAKEYGWDVTLLHKEGDEKVDFITVELYQLNPIVE